MKGEKFSLSSGVRGGRQKGFKSSAGASYTYNNPHIDDRTRTSVHITEAHLQYQANGIYAVFEIGNISYSEGELRESFGYYFDIGYNIGRLLDTPTQIYPWFRWTEYNTASKTLLGGSSEDAHKVSKWLFGVTVKPMPDVVFKAEVGTVKKGLLDEKTTVFNLGAGMPVFCIFSISLIRPVPCRRGRQ
ncbi:MAG: hypothetical protein GY940_05495 [bacterium]|nr:hypothetical protein [bacterium]